MDKGKGFIHIGDGAQTIYSAALAGGWDLPDEVATWALEMAQRLPQASEVVNKIAEAKAKAAAEHAERLRTDSDYRARQEELAKRRASCSLSISSSRKLPPWPMGPRARVDQDFQQVCLHSSALGPLMHVRPELTAEILLAVLIEGDPKEEYSRSLRDKKVGLDYDGGDSYPTAYWKSQLFSFLQIAPDVALTTLIRLVNFCTERWAHGWARGGDGSPPRMTLSMHDEREKTYIGNWKVFNWAQDSSSFIGQLHCALNALERWLTFQIERGEDVEPYLERLLQESTSGAFVGLLVNVAKYRPALLSGVLMPLVSSDGVFWLDQRRVQNASFHFNAVMWSRAGETIFNLARDWTMAPYRQQDLVLVVSKLIPRDKAIASFLKAAFGKWEKPDEPKAAVEFGILRAQLDESNYRVRRNPETGGETVEFEWPEALKREVAAYQQDVAPKLQTIMLADQCEQVLQGRAQLEDKDAQALADALRGLPTNEDDEERWQTRNKLAAAATLIANAQQWLKVRPAVVRAAKSVLRAEVETISDSVEELRRSQFGSFDECLKFAAYGVFHLWLQGGDEAKEWEQALLRVLTSGDDRAASVLGLLSYRHRVALGPRWWRLLQLGVLWSALSMLRPDYGDPPQMETRWKRWVGWLRSRQISGASTGHSSVDLLGVWQRLKRLERGRWHRAAAEDPSGSYSADDRPSYGLDIGFLDNLFDWLLADASRPEEDDLELGRQVLLALWAYETTYCFEHRDDRGEYGLPYDFGYRILAKLAFYAAHVPAESAPGIWRGVLGLGPAVRHLVEHFIKSWFIQLYHDYDPIDFGARWRAMIEFALDAKWTEDKHWLDGQRMLQEVLGFGSETLLANLPDPAQTVLSMRDIYQRWAEASLSGEEENVAAFSNFLASDVGAALRIDGLKWLAATFKGGGREQYWRRREGTGGSLVNLLDTVFREDGPVLVKGRENREALVALAAYLAARQVPGALSLQERIRHLG